MLYKVKRLFLEFKWTDVFISKESGYSITESNITVILDTRKELL